jgi:hypothetical protein
MRLQPLGNRRGWRYIGDVVVCPVCGRRSVHVPRPVLAREPGGVCDVAAA